MLPPPSPPGTYPAPSRPPGGAEKQGSGLAVLAVALLTLLGLIALVWYVNEQESDHDNWRLLPSWPASVAASGLVDTRAGPVWTDVATDV